MNPLKKLAGQTAIYGIPSILGRILGYLLVPLYTRTFLEGEYGTVNVFYSYASFLVVFLTYGMETAFFRFNEQEKDRDKVFGTGLISLLLSSTAFLFLASVFAGPIASWIQYPDHREYVIWFAWMLALDAVTAIPFARLRAQHRAVRFALIKMVPIVLNVVLNLFFILLCPHLYRQSGENSLIALIYRPDWGIEYIFVSNLITSALTLVLLLPEFRAIRWKIDPALWRKMFLYGFPLLFAGLAGMVNETMDRLLLRYLLPDDIASAQVGIYSACYKISILMTIFIQAYRYAAEPFFFAQAKEKDAKAVYAKIMDYFILAVCLIFLVTMLYLDDIFIRLIGRDFRSGRAVIPVLMLANLFLGVYYNLSIWYKLTGQTRWGAWLSVIGAVLTLIFNIWWIPLPATSYLHGYMGSAWATFICYGTMMVISYLLGQRYYPIPYRTLKGLGYLALAVALFLLSSWLSPETRILRLGFNTLLLLIFAGIAVWREKLWKVI